MGTRDYQRTARLGVMLALLIAVVAVTGCTQPAALMGSVAERVATAQLRSVPIRMLLAASNSAIEVATEEYLGTPVDIAGLIHKTTGIDIGANASPSDVASLIVINKLTNETQSWVLSKDVKSIRLNPASAKSIELRVVNDSPLRVEVWVEGSVEEVEAIVDYEN